MSVAGGDMQDQSTLQMLTGMIDFGLSAEKAVTAPQFGTDGLVFFSKQQKDGIGALIGVEAAGLDERLDQRPRQAALPEEVPADPPELGRVWGR